MRGAHWPSSCLPVGVLATGRPSARLSPVPVVLSWASRVGARGSTFWAFSHSSCTSVNGGCVAIPAI